MLYVKDGTVTTMRLSKHRLAAADTVPAGESSSMDSPISVTSQNLSAHAFRKLDEDLDDFELIAAGPAAISLTDNKPLPILIHC